MAKDIEVNEDGEVVSPYLHDASIFRIDFGRKLLSVYCRDPSGKCTKLNLVGITYMTSSNLAEENVLLDVSVLSGSDANRELIERLIPARTDSQEAYRDAVLQKLRERQLKLVCFSPSYGGEMTVFCEAIFYEDY